MTAPLASTPISPLFVPGDRPERFLKAARAGADAIIIDLEDAVAPERKGAARGAVAAHGITTVPVFVRINAAGTTWFEDDLAMLATANVTAIVVPKAEDAEVLKGVIQRTGNQKVIPLIETAAGIANLDQILRCKNVACAAFGSLDLALDLGCTPTWQPLVAARSELVLRSRLAGIAAPIDGVTMALDDLDQTQRDAELAREFGFRGKLAIHPKQIPAIRAAFAPNATERAWAEAVLAGFAAQPHGAFTLGGTLVDRPVVERARRIVEAS